MGTPCIFGRLSFFCYSPVLLDLFLPSTGKLAKRLVEERIVQLEIYLRKALHVLTMYGGMEKSASVALRHLQVFLTVEKYINCLYPPIIDDQRSIELLTYRFLNDYSSPACQQCVKFIGSVDLVNMVDYGGNGTPPAAGAGTGTAGEGSCACCLFAALWANRFRRWQRRISCSTDLPS